MTEPANKAVALKFLRTRLTGKARLGLNNNYADITALVNDVKAKCEQKTSPEELLAKLNAIKERDHEKVCDLVDSLTAKLSALYMADNIPADVAHKMATKAGVDTLQKKITNHDLKIILKAGSFTTVQQAIQKVRENAILDAPQQVLSYRANTRGRRNGPPQQQRYGPPQHQRYQNHSGNRGPRFQNFGNRGGRGSRYQYTRQNFGNNNHRQNFPPRNNIYYAEMGNHQAPQLGGVGGPVQTQNHPTQMHNQNTQMMPQPGQVSIAHMFQRQ